MTLRASATSRILIAAVFTISLSLFPPAFAQTAPSPTAEGESHVLGVVWSPPENPGPSLRQLDSIHDAGATALRLTRLPPADTVWSSADSLGFRLFVDLPISSVSVSRFGDSLQAIEPTIDRLRRLAQRHPSLHAIGLAHATNTSNPAVCPTIERWTTRQHEKRAGLQTYLVTPFPASTEKCQNSVDYPLLDTRGHESPVEQWAEWQNIADGAGLGGLGTWVHPKAGRGLEHPRSAERQARHLERALKSLLANQQSPPPIFVYRWQDETKPPLPTRMYGLHDSSGKPRPAASVLTGFYKGTQRVFAFPSGTAPFQSPAGPILIGWGVIILLGGLYAQNTFVRQTIARYFAAPSFYRDAVKKGRDVGPTENVLFLCSVTIAIGLVGTLAAQIAVDRPVTGQVLQTLPDPIRIPLAQGLAHPSLAGLFVGGVSLALLLFWAFTLTLAARAKQFFSFSQSLMLVTWPCWPAIPGLGIALVAATDPPVSAGILGLTLLIGGGLSIIAVSIRVLRDYRSVSGLAFPWLLLLTLPSPLAITGAAFVWLTIEYELPLRLLWHLLTRT